MSHNAMTLWQWDSMNQDPEKKAAKWNSAVINFIIYTWSFPTVTCPNVFSDKERGGGFQNSEKKRQNSQYV